MQIAVRTYIKADKTITQAYRKPQDVRPLKTSTYLIYTSAILSTEITIKFVLSTRGFSVSLPHNTKSCDNCVTPTKRHWELFNVICNCYCWYIKGSKFIIHMVWSYAWIYVCINISGFIWSYFLSIFSISCSVLRFYVKHVAIQWIIKAHAAKISPCTTRI